LRNLSKAGWSWGCVSTLDSNGRTIWIADAHCDDGKRYVVRADETLTAFLELESAIRNLRANCFDKEATFAQKAKGYENKDQIKTQEKKT